MKGRNMATFKQYTKKDGTKLWMFKTYLGTDANGKQITTTRRNFNTKKEAQLALSRLKVQFEKGEYNKPKEDRYTFNQVFEIWKNNYELTVKESTFVKVMSQYEFHILPIFGSKYIDTISVIDIQNYANDKVNEFVNYRNLITNISRIFDYAVNIGLIDANPTKRISIPKRKISVGDNKKQNYYTKIELKQFLDLSRKQQPYYIYAFFQLLAYSGCRKGEILGLQWRSVSFKDNHINIMQTLASGKDNRLYLEQPKTKHSKRIVSLDKQTMEVLKHWKKEQRKMMFQLGYNTMNDEQLVFSNIENSFLQVSKPRKWMLQTIHKNNLKEISIHGFRHTHATLLLEAGVSPKVISERLGHSSIQITLDLYSHVTEEMEREVPDIFANAVNFD